jgi:hypothetical protein
MKAANLQAPAPFMTDMKRLHATLEAALSALLWYLAFLEKKRGGRGRERTRFHKLEHFVEKIGARRMAPGVGSTE